MVHLCVFTCILVCLSAKNHDVLFLNTGGAAEAKIQSKGLGCGLEMAE